MLIFTEQAVAKVDIDLVSPMKPRSFFEDKKITALVCGVSTIMGSKLVYAILIRFKTDVGVYE